MNMRARLDLCTALVLACSCVSWASQHPRTEVKNSFPEAGIFKPEAVIGRLRTWYPDTAEDNWSLCTGTLIGPYTVLTAAHCVYSIDKKVQAVRVEFNPAVDGQDPYFKSYEVVDMQFLQAYKDAPVVGRNDEGNPLFDATAFQHDYAVLKLERAAGTEYGWFGFFTPDPCANVTSFVESMGYPGSLQGSNEYRTGKLWYTNCSLTYDSCFTVWYEMPAHDCTTEGGQSGSAIWSKNDEDGDGLQDYYIRGIHVGSSGKFVPLTETVYNNIYNWREALEPPVLPVSPVVVIPPVSPVVIPAAGCLQDPTVLQVPDTTVGACVAYHADGSVLVNSTISCEQCTFNCLTWGTTTSNCDSISYAGSAAIKRSALPYGLCPGAAAAAALQPLTAGVAGVCVQFDAAGRILDTQGMYCKDCAEQCSTWESCTTMVFNTVAVPRAQVDGYCNCV